MAAAMEKSLLSALPGLADADAKSCASILLQKAAKEMNLPSEALENMLRCACEHTTSQLQKLFKEEDALLELQKTSQTRKEGAQANVESVKKTVEFALQGGKEVSLAKLKVLKQAHQYAVGSSTNVLQSVLRPVEQKMKQVVTMMQTVAKEIQTISEELAKIKAAVAGKQVNDGKVVQLLERVAQSLQGLQTIVASGLSERQSVLVEMQKNNKSAEQAQTSFVQDKAVAQFPAQIDKCLASGVETVDITPFLSVTSELSQGVGRVVAYVDANEGSLPKLAQRMLENRQTMKRNMGELQKVQFQVGQEGLNVGSHVTAAPAPSNTTSKATGGNVAVDLENDEFSRLEAECLVQSENFHGFAKKLQGGKGPKGV
eukprot:gnl/MRDRNA2_/MRDRNA2_142362_c0_seq1.p1 gnl/MRDRNA2_/MRDRNA2_142362_c0~~gnl/MRDRNA2_/MRDRNA2_142362_c0_seq1.p1  ORF type:complete len:404 (-),score=97.38 gnl/MRDRNA2_/MRDRNA2_142362_c0_seq1:69-1184(-)